MSLPSTLDDAAAEWELLDADERYRLLIDLARQAARAYALETEMSEEEAFERIRAGIEADSLDPGAFN